MSNPDFIKYIESIQKRLDIPECKVSSPDGIFSACEFWECEFKSKETKDDK